MRPLRGGHSISNRLLRSVAGSKSPCAANAVTTFPATFLAFVFAVLGAFVFSSEYASGMILSTLTAAPRRGYVLTAKALVLTAISSAAALIVVASGIGVSMLQVPEVADVLGSTQVLTGMLGTVFFLVAISLFAFAVAGIARSTAGAITVVVGILLLLPMILQIMSGLLDWSWLATVQNYLPMTLGSNLGNGVTEEAGLSLRVQMEQADTGYTEVLSYRDSMFNLALWFIIPMAATVKLSPFCTLPERSARVTPWAPTVLKVGEA